MNKKWKDLLTKAALVGVTSAGFTLLAGIKDIMAKEFDLDPVVEKEYNYAPDKVVAK